MTVKSVIAGEYTAPPAHGPMIAEIWGMTPDASVLRRKMSAYPPSDSTPSWMRAPPESFNPTIGAPMLIARSITLAIFAAFVSESEPPKTVKSCANANTGRPSTRPWPATTPSPGHDLLGHAEVAAPVGDELVDLFETARVEEQIDPLPAP